MVLPTQRQVRRSKLVRGSKQRVYGELLFRQPHGMQHCYIPFLCVIDFTSAFNCGEAQGASWRVLRSVCGLAAVIHTPKTTRASDIQFPTHRTCETPKRRLAGHGGRGAFPIVGLPSSSNPQERKPHGPDCVFRLQRDELGEELIGSHRYQVHLHHDPNSTSPIAPVRQRCIYKG